MCSPFPVSKQNSDFENCHDTGISLNDTNFPARMSKYLCVVNDGIIKNLVNITGIAQKSPIFMADGYNLGNAVMSLGDIRFAITRISIDYNPHTSNRALCIEWSADGDSYKGYIDLDFNEYVS